MLSNLELMVVKEVHGAGATACSRTRSTKEAEAFRQRLLAIRPTIARGHPRAVDLPTFVEEGLSPRLSITAYVLSGRRWLVPGGLTRVA